MSYVVRRPRLSALAPLLVIPAFIAFTEIAGLPGFPIAFLVAFVLFSLYIAWQRSVVLKVDEEGVRLGRGVEHGYGRRQTAGAVVPWPSIRDVVLLGGEEVGVRLREGAPMPDGVRALIHDPANPDAVPPSLRVAVTGLDRERLDRAVQAFGRGARVAHG